MHNRFLDLTFRVVYHTIDSRRRCITSSCYLCFKGVIFDQVWNNKITAEYGSTKVYFLSLEDMIKKAAARAKDLEDLKYLENTKDNQ